MYMILSRSTAVEHDVIGYAETIETARDIVTKRIAECGAHADRLHAEAFKIVLLIETAPVSLNAG